MSPAIAAAGLDHDTVAKAVAEQLEPITGVHCAVSSAELAEGRLADTPLHRKILNNFSRRRSGDIYIVFNPHWMIAESTVLTSPPPSRASSRQNLRQAPQVWSCLRF